MDIKNIIRRTMAFVAIVAISAAAAMAQTVALKQDTNGKWGIAYTDGRGNWGKCAGSRGISKWMAYHAA